jgi:NAD(P)-dependent dehydrogenase (short-subunit alcohol dehydrogenase family)
MKKLLSKIAVVTGSTRGFGHAIAEALLKTGATVIITGRSQESLQRALIGLQTLGSVRGELCDVTVEGQVHQLADRVFNEFGRIDIWINNAGYSSAAGYILDFYPSEALEMFKANDLGTLYGTQAALQYMLPRKQGTLVNIYGAGSFLNPSSPTGLYAATKAWISSFTRTLAKELRGSGVQVLGFSPGMMLTDMLTSPTVIGENAKKMMERYGFVLRFLAHKPEQSAEKLVEVLATNRKSFLEYRQFKPWTPFLGLLRVLWGNITKTGKTPEYELQFREAYKFEGEK